MNKFMTGIMGIGRGVSCARKDGVGESNLELIIHGRMELVFCDTIFLEYSLSRDLVIYRNRYSEPCNVAFFKNGMIIVQCTTWFFRKSVWL
jgi:hypothetical protein